MIASKFILAILIAYLLGSIPFGLVLGRLKGKVDIRQYGSGRTGATNVLRNFGRKASVLVTVADIGKASLAVFSAGVIVGGDQLILGNLTMGAATIKSLAAIIAIIGHIWPVFAGFKGGRGVATFVGGLAVLCPVAALFAGELIIIGAGLSGYASLGSIAGVVGAYTIMIPLTIIYGFPLEYMSFVLAGSFIIILAHRDNIHRLLSGEERKLSQKARAGAAQT